MKRLLLAATFAAAVVAVATGIELLCLHWGLPAWVETAGLGVVAFLALYFVVLRPRVKTYFI